MPAPVSAVSGAYARLAEVLPGLAVTELGAGDETPHGGGWTTAADLATAGPALDRFLAWDVEQIERDYGRRARPDVVATFGLHRYAWPACLLITVPWFLHRRVPRYPVTHVSYDRTAPGHALGRMAVRPPASPACPATRRPRCPAPGSSPTRRRCGRRCGRRSPSTWSRY